MGERSAVSRAKLAALCATALRLARSLCPKAIHRHGPGMQMVPWRSCSAVAPYITTSSDAGICPLVSLFLRVFIVAVHGCVPVAQAWVRPAPVAAISAAPVSGAASAIPASASDQNDYKSVQAVLEQRCYLCHGEAVQMKNLRLDSPDSVKQHAQAIYQQVVVQKLMPMNNATQITDAERALIGRSFEAGAPTGP